MLSGIRISTNNLVLLVAVSAPASNALSFSLLSWACGIPSLRSLASAVDSLLYVNSITCVKYSPSKMSSNASVRYSSLKISSADLWLAITLRSIGNL